MFWFTKQYRFDKRCHTGGRTFKCFIYNAREGNDVVSWARTAFYFMKMTCKSIKHSAELQTWKIKCCTNRNSYNPARLTDQRPFPIPLPTQQIIMSSHPPPTATPLSGWEYFLGGNFDTRVDRQMIHVCPFSLDSNGEPLTKTRCCSQIGWDYVEFAGQWASPLKKKRVDFR